MVARAEIKRGNVYTLRGDPVEVVTVPVYAPQVVIRHGDGRVGYALPSDLRRVSARRKVTLKQVAKAYGGDEAVQQLEELMRRA